MLKAFFIGKSETEIMFLLVLSNSLILVSLLTWATTAKLTCEDGWFFYKNYCYQKLNFILTDYEKALHFCNYAYGSKVITINDKNEEAFVTAHFSNLATNFWVDPVNSKYPDWIDENNRTGM